MFRVINIVNWFLHYGKIKLVLKFQKRKICWNNSKIGGVLCLNKVMCNVNFLAQTIWITLIVDFRDFKYLMMDKDIGGEWWLVEIEISKVDWDIIENTIVRIIKGEDWRGFLIMKNKKSRLRRHHYLNRWYDRYNPSPLPISKDIRC